MISPPKDARRGDCPLLLPLREERGVGEAAPVSIDSYSAVGPGPDGAAPAPSAGLQTAGIRQAYVALRDMCIRDHQQHALQQKVEQTTRKKKQEQARVRTRSEYTTIQKDQRSWPSPFNVANDQGALKGMPPTKRHKKQIRGCGEKTHQQLDTDKTKQWEPQEHVSHRRTSSPPWTHRPVGQPDASRPHVVTKAQCQTHCHYRIGCPRC